MTRNHLVERIGAFAAFAIPLAVGVLAASPEPYWLDSPEFTAAAQILGIPHPPGHPLWVMLVKPFTLLPLGGIAFRVSLASAVFGASASVILYYIALGLMAATADSLTLLPRVLIACSSSLIASLAPGWWFQCVRAEVYSLQILLVLGALYPMVMVSLNLRDCNERLLYLAAFIAGLGLANHHYIMAVSLPAAVPVLVALAKYRGGIKTVWLTAKLAAVGAAGLLPYLFLPIRSAVQTAIALGGVHSVSDMFWVVSAKVYQKSVVKQQIHDFSARSLDLLFSMMGEIGPLVLVASAAGLYVLLRRRNTRVCGMVFFVLVAVTIFLRSLMEFDPFNPDYYGYMLPVAASAVLGFSALAATLAQALSLGLKRGGTVAAVLAAVLALVPIVRAREVRSQVDLSDFRATRLFVDLSLGRAQPGTVVLTSYYKLFFSLWSAGFIDGSRTDVTVVNPQLFGYPGYLSSTLAGHPELTGLARSMIVNGQVTEAAMADLAWKGPLRVEPDVWLPKAALAYLLPDGPVYIASPEPMTTADVMAEAPRHFQLWKEFYHLLGNGWKEHETWRMLSWSHYQDALFFADRGDRASALKACEMALALGSEAAEIVKLKKALEEDGQGPIDVSPFLPDAVNAWKGQ